MCLAAGLLATYIYGNIPFVESDGRLRYYILGGFQALIGELGDKQLAKNTANRHLTHALLQE